MGLSFFYPSNGLIRVRVIEFAKMWEIQWKYWVIYSPIGIFVVSVGEALVISPEVTPDPVVVVSVEAGAAVVIFVVASVTVVGATIITSKIEIIEKLNGESNGNTKIFDSPCMRLL